jgi:hypothetical protein
MEHIMAIVDVFIFVAIMWAFFENNRKIKLAKQAKELKH